ncbi:hypothetical protein [Lacticaseibacillus daqingensis]|uniref:hypothetical protein n=1 Tax=Lacticaseibacillus daqingensis TaxID=2486014 RepID=UPI000F78C4CB|nr:hypothetical protein [Lacticaseibacillus daqingensis]
MQVGLKGALIGALIAVAFLQWGGGGVLLIGGLALVGFLVERWLLPNQAGLMTWLRSGKAQLKHKP